MREYLLVFLVAAAVTYLLTVLAREIALRTGAVAEVRDRDVHAEPIPYLGGLAMLGGLVAAYAVARELPFLSTQNPFGFADAGAVLLAGGLVCGVGVLDDLFELDALTKLGGQVIAVAFLIYSGIQFIFIPTPTGYQYTIDQAQGALLTALVVIGTINAVNFVDGLDGLAAGVVGIGAAAFFVFSYQLANLNGITLATTGAFLQRRPRRRLRGVHAPQLPSSAAVHGGQRVDAAGPGALGERAHHHHPVPGLRDHARAAPAPTSTRSRSSCRCCCRSRSWSCRWSTSPSPSYAGPGRAARRSRRTSSTCTTGCSRSATATGGPW